MFHVTIIKKNIIYIIIMYVLLVAIGTEGIKFLINYVKTLISLTLYV